MNDVKVDPIEAERLRRRRGRNWAVFLSLLGFVVLVYGVTIVKIKMGYGP
jgi:hypothetical protein